jgi:hypothetical protein
VELGAWYAGIALCLLLVARLYFRLGVAGRYRALTAFLLISVLRSVLLASLPFNRSIYAECYFLTAPLLYGCHAWLVFELYGHLFDAYRGIAALSRWVIAGALLIGAVLAVLTSLWDHDLAREPFPLLGVAFQLESVVQKTLLAFLLLMSAVLLWFPIPQRWNVVLIGLGVTAMTLANTAAWVVRGLNPSAWTNAASTSSLYVFAGCMALWLCLMKRREEDIPQIEAIPAKEGMEALLLGRLRWMNQTLESIKKAS